MTKRREAAEENGSVRGEVIEVTQILCRKGEQRSLLQRKQREELGDKEGIEAMKR